MSRDPLKHDPREVRYLSDAEGRTEAVVVPIGLWEEISSELETRFLLSNPAMRAKLLASINEPPEAAVPLEEVLARCGVTLEEVLSWDEDKPNTTVG